MRCLLIVETNVSDPSWVKNYLVKVTQLLSKFSGKYITRISSIELLEGSGKPQYSLVAEFPTKEKAMEFYHSEEYAPYKKARQEGSVSKFLLVPIENASA